jgi:hypothetical protein
VALVLAKGLSGIRPKGSSTEVAQAVLPPFPLSVVAEPQTKPPLLRCNRTPARFMGRSPDFPQGDWGRLAPLQRVGHYAAHPPPPGALICLADLPGMTRHLYRR